MNSILSSWKLAYYDSRARYSKTKLGELWISLSILFSSVILSSVYGGLFGSEVYPGVSFFSYISLGLVFWNLLSECINRGSTLSQSITSKLLNTNDSIFFLVLRSYFYLLQSFIISLSSISLLLLLTTKQFTVSSLIYSLPAIIIFTIFSLLIFLVFSILSFVLKDLAELSPVLTTSIFLASPILYPASRLSETIFLKINFFYVFIGFARDSLLSSNHQNIPPYLSSPIGSLLILLLFTLLIYFLRSITIKHRFFFTIRAE